MKANELFCFGAAKDGGGSVVTEGTAKVSKVTVSGDINEPIDSTNVVITLSDDEFSGIREEEDVSLWFTNRPDGLVAEVDSIEKDDTEITITISGEPTEAVACIMQIVIPDDVLASGSEITVDENPEAKYDIALVITGDTDFQTFADRVNAGEYALSGKLSSSSTVINVDADEEYIPIARPVMGPNDELIYNPYIGTFNGNGGTITIDLTGSASYLALFGANNGMIQNLTVAGSVTAEIDTNNPKDIDYVAGVVAYNDIHGTIEHVISQVAITADDSFVTSDHKDIAIHSTGGIAGFNGWDIFSPDSPHCDPEHPENYQEGGTILQCRNEGTIIGGDNKIGGIAGENAGDITECSNWGNIKCVKNGELHPRWPGVGGIAGRNGNNNTAVEHGNILNCYNRGTIIDQTDENIDHNDYGGITGWCDKDSTVKSCYTSGPFEQYVEDPDHPGTYITHPVTGTKNPIIGSIDKDVTTMTNDNNYALKGIDADSKDPILIGISKKCCEMTDPTFVTALNGTGGGPYVAVLNKYPILSWEAND